MRLGIVALALALLALPVHANAPPVAIADVQAEARLGEPIVFRDASVDPDGEIVAAEWEFSDGRTAHGRVVTRVLGYAGPHTITLHVQDDAGAWASTEVLVLVRAPLMQGRATAASGPAGVFADTDAVATEQQVHARAAEGEVRHGQLRIAALASEVQTVSDAAGPRAASRADVGHVYIPLPVGYVLLTGVEAEAIVGCSFPTVVNAKFTQVRLNDGALVPPGEVAPNTLVALPDGGSLTLNAQEWRGDVLAVTAARHVALDGTVTEIARAEAGVSHCPW